MSVTIILIVIQPSTGHEAYWENWYSKDPFLMGSLILAIARHSALILFKVYSILEFIIAVFHTKSSTLLYSICRIVVMLI